MFFTANLHAVADIGENSRLDEIATIAGTFTTDGQFSTLGFSGFDVTQNLIELLFVHLSALFVIQIEGISDSSIFSTFNGSFDEFIVNIFFDHDTRAGATTLAHVEKKSLMSDFNGLLHISVFQNDGRRFS